MNLTQKIIKEHLIKGTLEPGSPIEIKMDQTLTQDATGTMAYMQLEAMGIKRVKTEISVSYVDHNTLQNGYMNADDHAYLQSVAAKYGVYFSRPGNGICHQVHLERFAKPSKTLIGSDSHTPTSGAMGCLAIGAGGLDVAKAMAGIGYRLTMPKVVQVNLHGKLSHGVSSKDIILELLKRLSVKGGVSKVFEYTGEGVKDLSVYQRATITNMGAELGATTSIFPSDEITLAFLKQQNREEDYIELKADEDATYDEYIDIDLSSLRPMAACPDSPDAIKNISELKGIKIDQVAIGSCTNSGYEDLMKAATILKGKTIAPNVSLVVSPGSRQVMMKLIQNGALATFIQAGARILECACGPCIGMGQSPKSDGISLRTFNRNFYGRSGTLSAGIYLVSPEVAALSAIKGYMSQEFEDDMYLDEVPNTPFIKNQNFFIDEYDENNVVYMGPNIKPVPRGEKISDEISGKVVLKVGDNISTDHIVPSDSKLLPYRSNVPHLAKYSFSKVDPEFYDRAIKNNGGFIVGGDNYGQGSSREHAALVPNYLKIKAIFAVSFARIHRSNLINNGILPLVIEAKDQDFFNDHDTYKIVNIKEVVANNGFVKVINETTNDYIEAKLTLSPREKVMINYGGLLNAIKELGGDF